MEAQMITICNGIRATPIDWISLLPVTRVEEDATSYEVTPEYTLKIWNDSTRASISSANKHFVFGLNPDGKPRYQEMRVHDPATRTRTEFKILNEGVTVHQIITPRINVTKMVTVPNGQDMSSIVDSATVAINERPGIVPFLEGPEIVPFLVARYRAILPSARELNEIVGLFHDEAMLHVVIKVTYTTPTHPTGVVIFKSSDGTTRNTAFSVHQGNFVFTHVGTLGKGKKVAVNLDSTILSLI